MLHERPASPNSFSRPSSSSSFYYPPSQQPYIMNGGSPDDLYRSAFALSKLGGPTSGANNNNNTEHHSRHPSTGSSHSSFSLATSTALSTPNDSPPLDFLNSPTAGGGGKVLSRHETGPIRRVRQDASASPYPPQPLVRSNSFSGSDSHRSSSSEAEDIGSLFPSYHHHQQQQHHHHSHPSSHHQNQDYTTAMYSQPNRSNPGLGGNPLDPNPGFQRMTVNSDQALEQLAANVRAATTTSASDRAKHIFVQAWHVLSFILCAYHSDLHSRSNAHFNQLSRHSHN
jgi:regulatory factor X